MFKGIISINSCVWFLSVFSIIMLGLDFSWQLVLIYIRYIECSRILAAQFRWLMDQLQHFFSPVFLWWITHFTSKSHQTLLRNIFNIQLRGFLRTQWYRVWFIELKLSYVLWHIPGTWRIHKSNVIESRSIWWNRERITPENDTETSKQRIVIVNCSSPVHSIFHLSYVIWRTHALYKEWAKAQLKETYAIFVLTRGVQEFVFFLAWNALAFALLCLSPSS